MDRYDDKTDTFLINGNDYKIAVAKTYLETICGFSAAEADAFLESLRAETAAEVEDLALRDQAYAETKDITDAELSRK